MIALARDFSPRIETHGDRSVTLDISGLGSLLGDARAIGEELRRAAADRRLRVHVAITATRTAAIVLAQARAGLTVIPPGEEAAALAPLPLAALRAFGEVPQLERWGLRTLSDLAAIPRTDLSERLGQGGVYWQRLARGEDVRPLVPSTPEERFEESLDLEWPIEGLEPLSFVLGRLCEPLCARLEQCDRGAVVLHVHLALVTRDVHDRSLQLPAPMRDPRVLRTLILLDLESHPPPAAIDRLTIAVDVTEGRILQFGLFVRALPAERVSTLLARLEALMGADRVGAPALVDSYRPGAFTMAEFAPFQAGHRESGVGSGAGVGTDRFPIPDSRLPTRFPCTAIRRFRLPVPARVTLEQGRPVRVTTDRRGFSGGRVEQCAGPWRSSGEWWLTGVNRTGFITSSKRSEHVRSKTVGSEVAGQEVRRPPPRETPHRGVSIALSLPMREADTHGANRGCTPSVPVCEGRDRLTPARLSAKRSLLRSDVAGSPEDYETGSRMAGPHSPWNVDEWDVVLSDGTAYRISENRERRMWFVDGVLD